MAQTGVLPFVRGIDFTRYEFDQSDRHPKLLSEMQRLRWLRINNTGMESLPDDVVTLKKLEQLHVTHNKLNALSKQISELGCLKVINARDNKLTNDNVPKNLHKLEDLSVLDLSFNELTSVPQNVEEAKSIIVLNLSHNKIPNVPNHLFINLTDLVFLDLSSNKLESLPPQLKRLIHLKTLILNDNPLLNAQLRQLPSLVSLESLHLRNTQRTGTNIPSELYKCSNLKEIDLSCNELQVIPDVIYSVRSLKRLNFSQNNLSEVSSMIGELEELVVLNLSRNKLLSLPAALCKLQHLKKLYVNSNYLNFVGIPAGIGKLGELEIFSASDNRLETLPEGLCRCGKLRKLLLNKNRLYALPESIHFLQLQELDVSDNPNFKMPPKPIEMQKAVGAGALFYNIDFSLQSQLLAAGASPQELSELNTPQLPVKDPIARKKRLKLLKQSVNENDSSKVLKGMRDVAESKKAKTTSSAATSGNKTGEGGDALIKGKRWDEQLEKPKLDYSEFFEDDVGHEEGIVTFEIEKFLPNQLDSALNGKFYDGDCYIILKTFRDDTGSLNWKIFYWIGSQASIDKQACAAMHAVNLRNLLGATCRTQREEQFDESDAFRELFNYKIKYVEGAMGSSGFYTVEDIEYITRMYRISGTQRILLEPVPLHYKCLDPAYVYLLDNGLNIYLWNGARANPITCSKARLFAEKINKYERKFQAELVQMKQGDEVMPFWRLLQGPPPADELIEAVVNAKSGQKPAITVNGEQETKYQAIFDPEFDHGETSPLFSYYKPKLYKVGIGMGYLELPQVRANTGKLILTKELLDTKSVYILDCYTDIFVWIGRKSTRLIRTAALKLSGSLELMINRPSFTLVTSTLEGSESQIFKSKFEGWDDLIEVDYTRTAETVSRKLATLKRHQQQYPNTNTREGSVDSSVASTSTLSPIQTLAGNNSSLLRAKSVTNVSALSPLLQNPTEALKTDLTALFKERYVPMSDEDAINMMEETNDFLESMECFIFENKKFIRLPENEIGQFYSGDSYLFVCKYWKIDESDEADDQQKSEEDENVAAQSSIECKIYFWQGRDANNAGWLTFTFTIKKKFKDIEIIKFNQQQESPQFLSHFDRKFVIHKGKRKEALAARNANKSTNGVVNTNGNMNHYDEDHDSCSSTYNTQMYHLRRNPYSAVCTRCIELNTAKATNLCSEFCYIVCVPLTVNTDSDTRGAVYVWIGSKSNPEEARIAEELAQSMYDVSSYSIQVLNEGEEPETFFWVGLGGKQPYDKSADYMRYMRLFRCSNDRGYFSVTEKCIDFCQDDLADDDVMILDSGSLVYLWVGPTSSEIEVKLAFKSAQVYIQHLRIKQPHLQRKLLLTTKGKEPPPFTKCFHAWSKHKNPPKNLEKKVVLKPVQPPPSS